MICEVPESCGKTQGFFILHLKEFWKIKKLPIGQLFRWRKIYPSSIFLTLASAYLNRNKQIRKGRLHIPITIRPTNSESFSKTPKYIENMNTIPVLNIARVRLLRFFLHFSISFVMLISSADLTEDLFLDVSPPIISVTPIHFLFHSTTQP